MHLVLPSKGSPPTPWLKDKPTDKTTPRKDPCEMAESMIDGGESKCISFSCSPQCCNGTLEGTVGQKSLSPSPPFPLKRDSALF